MGSVWTATIKAIRDENARRLHEAEKSFGALKNKDGWYADDHRKVIELRKKIGAVIRQHSSD